MAIQQIEIFKKAANVWELQTDDDLVKIVLEEGELTFWRLEVPADISKFESSKKKKEG